MKVDMHSHVIYAIDDGAITLIESMQMLEAAKSAGISVIVATPHYQEGLFDCPDYDKKFQEIANAAQNIGITLLRGAEVAYSDALLEKDVGEEYTIGGKYILLELPYLRKPGFEEYLHKKLDSGIIPIIAHAERYWYFKSNLKLLRSLRKMGCKIQVNSGSLINVYGYGNMLFARSLIKKGLVDYIATGCHSMKGYLDPYENAYKDVVRMIGREKAYRLFEDNPTRLVYDVMGVEQDLDIGGIKVD